MAGRKSELNYDFFYKTFCICKYHLALYENIEVKVETADNEQSVTLKSSVLKYELWDDIKVTQSSNA